VSLPHYEPEPTVDYRQLAEDTIQLWRNHDAIPDRSSEAEFVALVRYNYYDARGVEQRVVRSLFSGGLENGELCQLLLRALQRMNEAAADQRTN
jgi:hypothetical protein